MKTQNPAGEKQVKSKLTDTKVYMPIHYNKPADVIKELQEIHKLTQTDAREQIAAKQSAQNVSANLFQVENFQELSDGGDDRVPSQSEQEPDREEEAKDAGSTIAFQRLVTELNQAGTMQSVLAVSSINMSIDFSSAKFRQTFTAQSGVSALMKMVSCMVTQPIGAAERQQYILQDLQRTEPKVVYDILLILCTLAEASKESRKALLGEDVLRVAISLVKTQFSQQYAQQTMFKARCYRLIASLLLVSSARNYTRRIGGIAVFVKQFRQAIRDYQFGHSEDNATLITAVAMTFESLLKSQRCRQAMIRQKLVQTLIDSLATLPIQAHVSEDLVIQTGLLKKPGNLDDIMMESISNCLRLLSMVQQGRTEILQAYGIEKICNLLQSSRSTKVIQRSVAVLANCAQDSGVDQAVRKAKGLKVLSAQLSSQDFQTLEAICKTIVSVCRSGPYFGGSASCLSHDKGYLGFNKRNEDNIIDLCCEDTVNQLGRLVRQPKDVLADAGLDQNPLIVARNGEGEQAKIVEAKEARELVVLATEALIPLFSSKRGRQTLKSNQQMLQALTSHLSIGDVEVLISTLHALYVACEKDADIAKLISIKDPKAKQLSMSDTIKAMFTLLGHKNIQVVTAAAMALNPICRDKQRAFMVGREIPTALIQVSRLLRKKIRQDTGLSGLQDSSLGKDTLSQEARQQLGADEFYDFDAEDAYLPLLLEEQYGWLMGVVAELAQDKENARVFSQYNVLNTICDLCNAHSENAAQHRGKAYNFHINQLIKEKSALALASLAKVEQNMVRVAELNTIPALVRCICTPDGVPLFTFNSNQLLGTRLQGCQNPFGSAVNFSLENQVKKMEERRHAQEEKDAKRKAAGDQGALDRVDRDPQHTANPYSVVNCAACRAMAELSLNKTCALLLRQYGAVYGLLTLAGSEEQVTQQSAAQAIMNIRTHHLKALELYRMRTAREKEFTQEEPKDGRISDRKVYDTYVQRAVEALYADLDQLEGDLKTQDDRHNSTLAILRRNETVDRLNAAKEVELVGDNVFNQRSELKIEAVAVTFNAVIGVLKHPQTEEPLDRQLDNDPIQKEAQCASIEWKKAASEEAEKDEALQAAQEKKMKPVIKERPPRVAQPLGWKSGGSEADRQAAEVFRTLKKDRIDRQDVVGLLDVLRLPQEFFGGLFKLNDEDADGLIDEQQFSDLYRVAQGAAKLDTQDKHDLLFFALDELQDGRVHAEEFKKAANKLGVQVEIDEPIAKADFKTLLPPELFEKFYQ